MKVLAVSYARVSSKPQEDGFSLISQNRTLTQYAASREFEIVRDFTSSESAKKQGRKNFNAMLAFLREHPDPTDEQIRAALSGNLCRCTGYQGILAAVRAAADSISTAAQETKHAQEPR